MPPTDNVLHAIGGGRMADPPMIHCLSCYSMMSRSHYHAYRFSGCLLTSEPKHATIKRLKMAASSFSKFRRHSEAQGNCVKPSQTTEDPLDTSRAQLLSRLEIWHACQHGNLGRQHLSLLSQANSFLKQQQLEAMPSCCCLK